MILLLRLAIPHGFVGVAIWQQWEITVKFAMLNDAMCLSFLQIMDADLETRVTRSGRRVRQLVIIPDAHISEAEAESDDDVDDPDYGTTLPESNQDDESDVNSDEDDVPLIQLQQTNTSDDDDDIPLAALIQSNKSVPSSGGNKSEHSFHWRSMNPPVVDSLER